MLHHLAGPDAGLRALREVLTPHGALHLMVYAPYGRAGVYMLQDYCRHLGIGWSEREINDLAATLKTLPPDHPLVPLLRDSPDFGSAGGLADALLHPQDRAYTVAEFLGLMDRTGLKFGRWLRQAPYLPDCGAIANAPHAALLRKLALTEQFAALELLRGTMVRHAAVAYRDDAPARREVEFDNDSWVEYVPIRLPGTIAVRERLPAGAAAVLINRNHTYTDLYLPIDAPRLRLWEAIDGTRTIAEIIGDREDRDVACDFFEQLWNWDQTVFALDAQP